MIMDKKLFMTASAVLAALALTACSEAPKPEAETKAAVETKKEAPKPAGPVAAQTAFWECYKPARTWATDLLPLSITSGEAKTMKNEDGKAAIWSVIFVSPSKREARTITYSVVDEPGFSKGVDVGGAQQWSGATAQSQPFATSDLIVNSDAAFKTAADKAADWLKKNPDKKWQMVLGKNAKFAQPVWYIIWGTPKNGYASYVNAVSGAIVAK